MKSWALKEADEASNINQVNALLQFLFSFVSNKGRDPKLEGSKVVCGFHFVVGTDYRDVILRNCST